MRTAGARPRGARRRGAQRRGAQLRWARGLFAAPAAHRALREGRVGVVELVLREGAYVRFGADWLLLAPASAPFGPLSLAVDALASMNLSPGLPVSMRGGHVVIGMNAVSCRRMGVRSSTPRVVRRLGHLSAIRGASAAAWAALPSPPAVLRRGISALLAGRMDEAVDALAGLGDGLTPAGDDVLAGYAASRAALGFSGGPVALSTLARPRSSALGFAYLRCAERLELPDAAAGLLVAVCRGSAPEVRSALPALRAWGASSGTALAWGIAAATRVVDAAWHPASPGSDSGPTDAARSIARGGRRTWRAQPPFHRNEVTQLAGAGLSALLRRAWLGRHQPAPPPPRRSAARARGSLRGR